MDLQINMACLKKMSKLICNFYNNSKIKFLEAHSSCLKMWLLRNFSQKEIFTKNICYPPSYQLLLKFKGGYLESIPNRSLTTMHNVEVLNSNSLSFFLFFKKKSILKSLNRNFCFKKIKSDNKNNTTYELFFFKKNNLINVILLCYFLILNTCFSLIHLLPTTKTVIS